MLTPSQLAHFDTFGFVHLRRLFSAEESAAMRNQAEALWHAERQRHQLAPDAYLSMAAFLEHSPALLRLATDDRIYGAAQQLLGPGYLWSGSEGNTGAAQSNTFHAWHCDRPGEAEPTYRRIKIMLYLTPMTVDNGCLRVIPGSHKLPMYRTLDPLNAQGADTSSEVFGVAGEELPSFPLQTLPGDAVIFDHYLYHGVYQGDGSRRYLAMKFVARPQNDQQLASILRTSPYFFAPDSVLTTSDSPRIRAMVDPIADLAQRAQKLTVPA